MSERVQYTPTLTEFERPRGVSDVKVVDGFAQIHVTGLPGEVNKARLEVLQAVANGGVSLDFLKLTPAGLSFLVSADQEAKAGAALASCSVSHAIHSDRSIIMVHAVNIRDEEGMIAAIVQALIESGVHLDHLSDMHDRMLVVVPTSESRGVEARMREQFSLKESLHPPTSTRKRPAAGNRIKVMKFGGTSVATAETRNSAALRVVQAKEQGFLPVVVVSAIGRKGAAYATDTLIGILREIEPLVVPDDRELDMLLACGEILSAVIFAHTLKTLGHPAQAFRGDQAGIRTDERYGNARIISIQPDALVHSIHAGYIPVVCGFQGAFYREGMPGSELTTLGRGGSDTTGAAIGVALEAERVEIFTDVDGIKTADPDAVPEAPTLPRVTYDEVAEIAHLGAKVVHPRAAEIAMHDGIPLWVKKTTSDQEGTLIVAPDQYPHPKVTGVTHAGKLVYMQFDLTLAGVEERPMLEGRIYETMARYGIPLYMLNLSPTSTGFAVDRDQYPVVQDVLDGLVIPASDRRVFLFQIGQQASKEVETQARLLAPLGEILRVPAQLTEGCTMVSLVGHGYIQRPGVFFSVLRTLGEGNITVLQTSDSDYSLSVLVPESETNRSVRLLHDKFCSPTGR